MEAQDSDRIGTYGRRPRRFDLTYPFFAVLILAIGGIALFGWNADTVKGQLEAFGLMKREDFTDLYKRLGVTPLVASTEASTDVHAGLAKLQREPCDPKAIFKLTEAVAKAGEERWGAEALVGWAGQCGPDTAGDLRKAATLFLGLHDYPRAFAIAKQLTDAHPHVGNYWYVKAKAEVGLKRVDDALLSYANAIHLEAVPRAVGSWVFYEMSDLYAASTRFCEAIGPIQDYVSLDPATRNTGNAQRLMTDYATKGHCTAFAAGSETFPVADANVIKTRVAINGVSGLFVVDTGASFVTVTDVFAQKAHLEPSGPAMLRSMTANGAVYSKLASAGSVRVGRVDAKQVPVAILDQSMGPTDGLLGRSFLSRFDVTITSDHWSLRPKTTIKAR